MEQRFSTHLMTTLKMAALATIVVAVLTTNNAMAFTAYQGNGITARIHHAADLSEYIDTDQDSKVLNHPVLSGIELLNGVDDARLPRRDVDAFHPLLAEDVIAALSAVEHLGMQITVDVLLLPAPPAEVLGSYSTRNIIILSPGFARADSETVAWLVTHELGHVLTWAYFDRHPGVWDQYRDLRGLSPEFNGPSAMHADREREILAEDIRYLFGGAAANTCGCIENDLMPMPDDVAGLETFLRATLSGSPVATMVTETGAWPNPCNPQTTIELRLPEGLKSSQDGASARLEILDIRGRRVRVINGGELDNNRLAIRWNGFGDDGTRVATGRYFYRIGWDGLTARGSVTVVR